MKTLVGLWREVRNASSAALEELEYASGPKPTAEMCEFLMLGEDQRMASHFGVDPTALVRSIWMTCVFRKRQGGSTIAMQLVRTITRRYERTIWRKVTEIILAVRLTRTLDRMDIARVYLWLAYYGWNMHGFQQAHEKLALTPSSSSKVDSANLVARLKYPQPRHRNEDQISRIRQRVRYLLALDSDRKNRGALLGIADRGSIPNS